MASCNLFFSVAILFFATTRAAPTEDSKAAIKLPAECRGQRFCVVKPEGYDDLEDRINSVLPNFLKQDYADRIGEEIMPPKPSPEEDWHNCPYETQVQSMYLYNHGTNETKTDIIVQTKLFRQYVKIVSCMTQHIDQDSPEQCFQGLGVRDFGMRSYCHESTATRTLYVYDIEKGEVVPKSFEVPACCTCKVAYNN